MDALTSTAPDRASIEKRLQGLESLLYHDKQCSSLYHGLAADICEDFLAFANNIPQWKPIAEMPEELTRDGSRFFVWAEGVPPMVTEIFGGDMKQDGEEYRFLQFEPTHFMDCVPKPPPDDKAVPYIRADLAPQWKPIAEAPKDGTRILGTSLGTAIHCYYWRAGAFQSWFIEYAEGAPWQPTHWMPLPAAPQAEAEEGGGDIDGMLRESSS